MPAVADTVPSPLESDCPSRGNVSASPCRSGGNESVTAATLYARHVSGAPERFPVESQAETGILVFLVPRRDHHRNECRGGAVNPPSTRCSFIKLRRSNPAPVRSIKESASLQMTRAFRLRPRERVIQPVRAPA